MKLVYLVVAGALGILFALSPGALAVDSSPKTLAQCAELLPAGQAYTYQLKGTIDTTTGRPVLSGSFTVEDGTTVDRQRESEAFGKCVAAIVGA